MSHRRLSFASVVCLSLIACADPASEPVATANDSLHAGACGPVHFTGDGYGPRRDDAHAAAEKVARSTCEETPMFCGVDCANAPITWEECGPAEENSRTWYCALTIAASSPVEQEKRASR